MIRRIACFELVTPDIERLARFYVQALGFQHNDGCLRLGEQTIRLVPATAATQPYPADSTAADLWFQHFAIVTNDMAAAVTVAQAAGGVAITQGGPQHLPQRAGAVHAWKFRDPDLHPLELLQFPPDAVPTAWRNGGGALHLGIDHSAISVADVDASIAHYQTQFGFTLISRQTNHGIEQSRLDAIRHARTEVVGLCLPAAGPPHLELLGYQPAGRPSTASLDAVAATRIVLDTNGSPPPGTARDPDGHWTRWQ